MGLLSSAVGLELVVFLVLGVSYCMLPSDWVWDFIVEVVEVERVHSWVVHHKRCVATWAEVFPICCEGFVFGFK